MSQSNSPRSSDDPAAKTLAQGLFGLNFAPGGPVADPDDLDGLDFDLLPPAPQSAPEPAKADSASIAEDDSEPEEAAPITTGRPAKPEKASKSEAPRKSAPRIRVPRDDDGDDGFGAGLLDAFDDDDTEYFDSPATEDVAVTVTETSVMKFAEIEVPDDDDLPVAKPARASKPGQKSKPAKASAKKGADKAPEDKAPEIENAEEAAAEDTTQAEVARPKDDFWDALEGWDWELSESSDADASPEAEAPKGRGGRRPRGRDTGRSRSKEQPAPVVTEAVAEIPDESAPTPPKSSGRGGRKSGDRKSKAAKADKAPAAEVKPASILDEAGGFADDLFERLEPESRGKKSVSALSQLAAELDEVDRSPGDAIEEKKPARGRGRRAERGHSKEKEASAPREDVRPSLAEVESFESDDDGFGAGLSSPRRGDRRTVEADEPRSRRPVREERARGDYDREDRDDRDHDDERRPVRSQRRDYEEQEDSPPRRRSSRDESRIDRDEEMPARARRDRDEEVRDTPRYRSRDDRPYRDEPVDDAPRRIRREESSSRRDDSDDRDELARPKVKTIEVPTWEHAISLLVRRPPKQDRGSDRPAGRDDRGGRGRGRRRSNEN